MAKKYTINITNGTGTSNVVVDNYSATITSTGYKADSLVPKQISVTKEQASYAFTVAAEGTLTLHVTEEGTAEGTPVVGAKFVRCDSEGNTYGDEIQSNEQGNAVFNYLPYAADGAPTIYYKQTASDGEHDYDNSLLDIQLLAQTYTQEIINSLPTLKTFTVTDANYSGLPIAVAQLELN